MKKLTLFMAILFLLSACSPPPDQVTVEEGPVPQAASAAEISAEDKIFVGCSMPADNGKDAALTRLLKEKIEQRNLPIEIQFLDSAYSTEIQLSQVEYFIARKASLILVDPVSYNGSASLVAAANSAGIPIATVLSPVDAPASGGIFCHIGNDYLEVGKTQFRLMAQALDGKGSIAVLRGFPENAAQILISRGYEEAAKDFPDILIVREQYANQSASEAYAIVENWLYNGEEITAILAQDDSMALGAAEAVAESCERESGMRSISIYGVDVADTDASFKAAQAAGANDERVSKLKGILLFGAGGYADLGGCDLFAATVDLDLSRHADQIIDTILGVREKKTAQTHPAIPVKTLIYDGRAP